MLAVDSGGRLLMYRGTGAGTFVPGGGVPIGSGWGGFTALLAPGDWSGDGKPRPARAHPRRPAAALPRQRERRVPGRQRRADRHRLGRFTALLAPRDWNGDGHPDILARTSDGKLLMYRGNGAGGFLQPIAQQIGSGWQVFTALLAPFDWSGDGKPDILARDGDGKLFMYRGNGKGGFVTGQRELIGGGGWQAFTALFAGGDFSGDGRPDIIARDADGLLFMYRGNGRGGFITGQREQIGSGWSSLGALTLVWDVPRPRSGSRCTADRRAPPGQREAQVHQGLHAARRAIEGPRPHPPPRGSRAPAGALRGLLGQARRQAGRPPAPVRRAAADAPARGQEGARVRAGLLPALGVEEAAAQDGVEAVQDVPGRSVN